MENLSFDDEKVPVRIMIRKLRNKSPGWLGINGGKTLTELRFRKNCYTGFMEK
jgi:hypothetical protein